MASVYANKTVLTQTSPLGVTHVFEGLDAVTGFYVAAWQYFHGITRAQDHIRNLASTGVLSYEHAGRPRQAKPGLCAPHSRCAVAASAASTGLPTRGVFRDRQMSQEGNDNHQNGPTEQCRDMALPTPPLAMRPSGSSWIRVPWSGVLLSIVVGMGLLPVLRLLTSG